ncbi:type II toxin-antitoxin system HipA family toxin [Pseudomonas japonica]|uniref:Serine/threonine-protein kinase HipA n=1 Tax=Pseudomonas japonica TaxID=256466 RepID=A0A239BCJ1_9PSED|nr:HipA domain-containing protein [Pseudomonas japonica]SNS05271.1 serine/threonine-protein kinase HipA [Pseudomonas japonica]
MYPLTLQLYAQGKWQDAMTLNFAQPENGFLGPCQYAYVSGYVRSNLEAYQSTFEKAVSVNLPVDFDSHRSNKAPAFLHDIAPSGAARRFLLRHMVREKPEGVSDDIFLLTRSAPAPIGNLRIKESVEVLDTSAPMGFSVDDVVTRDQRFLEYAYEQGAAIGGATGAGGEAPKLLLTEGREGLLYPDAVLDDGQATCHWFVKFARNQALADDQTILRAEYLYYKALRQLGIDTVETAEQGLKEAAKPSLWLKRFDRKTGASGVERLAVESVYSLTGVTEPGSQMDHLEVIEALASLWIRAGQKDQVPDLVAEYLRRDLINKILGNSDNHGRNTAIIRSGDKLRLAPIYDLAPMVMDAEGITRTTKWASPVERGGEVDWLAACRLLEPLVDPQQVFERLRHDARALMALPDLLVDSGLPETVMSHPAIALKNLEQRMKGWGLL